MPLKKSENGLITDGRIQTQDMQIRLYENEHRKNAKIAYDHDPPMVPAALQVPESQLEREELNERRQQIEAAEERQARKANEQLRGQRQQRKRMVGFEVIVAIVIIISFASVCGFGYCNTTPASSASISSEPATSTSSPTLAPFDEARAQSISNLINLHSVSDVKYGNSTATDEEKTNEEKALQWLIEADPLRLQPDSMISEMRLFQRFVLATLLKIGDNTFQDYSGNECDWQGIACEVNTTKVQEIDLSARGLTGRIPQDIGLLTSLIVLSLQENALTGDIPSSLVTLNKLRGLDLTNNRLGPKLPGDWSGLSSLEDEVSWLFDGITQFLPRADPHRIGFACKR